MGIEYKPGDQVSTYSHLHETFVVLQTGTGRLLQLRAADGREFWVSAALVKPIAQVDVQG